MNSALNKIEDHNAIRGFLRYQERRTDPRSGTKNMSRSSRRTENRSTANQILLLFPTTNPQPPTPAFCFFLQLASWNLQLSSYKRSANSKNEEQILALERRTCLLGERRTTQCSTRFSCSFLPLHRTCYNGRRNQKHR